MVGLLQSGSMEAVLQLPEKQQVHGPHARFGEVVKSTEVGQAPGVT